MRMLAREYFGKVIIRRFYVVLDEIDPQGHASCLAEATVVSCISFGCIIDEQDQRVLYAPSAS